MSSEGIPTNHDLSNCVTLTRRQSGRALPKRFSLALFVLSALGFVDTAYLTAKHFQGAVPPCPVFSGCDVVTASQYSTIGPVPVALLGALFYLSVFVLALWYFDRGREVAIKLVALFSVPAFLFTLWLTYLQIFVLQSVCTYCVFSALLSSAIFVISQRVWRKTPQKL